MYKFIYSFIFTILVCLSIAFAVPEGELEGELRTPLDVDRPYNYGIPGYANIYIKPFKSDIWPSGDERLYIEFEHEINYGGRRYDGVTIYGNGKIFLGDHRESASETLNRDGIYPYVLPINNEIIPSVGNGRIFVSWRKFDEHGDVFTVIEIGTFQVSGKTDPMICQVSFYRDGEIQVQYWNKNRSNAYLSLETGAVHMAERDYMGTPSVYTGSQKITLSDKANTSIYAGSAIDIFNNGKLRKGWIAKGFASDEAQFKIIDKEIDVQFGPKHLGSGGVIAYDNARENPVVGSFSALRLKVYSVNYGDGNTEQTPTPVFFWYFNEHPSFYNNSHIASYPQFSNTSFGPLNDCPKCIYQNGSLAIITPAAYKNTWNKYLTNPLVNPDTIIAPAIKMQTWGDGKNRHIRIKYAALSPLQPRSIQFFPPKTLNVRYKGDVGYMTVNNDKAPVALVEKSDLDAIVHTTPGYVIKQIFVNGLEGYNADDPSKFLNGISITYDESQKVAVIKTNKLTSHLTIEAIFEECSEKDRVLPKVVPSYVKSEMFLDPAEKSKVLETYSVKDGFGRVVQTQVPLTTGKFKISALYLDEAGNTKYAPIPYVSNKGSYEYEDMFCEKCVDKSRNYYNGDTKSSKERIDSYNHPYTETEHFYGMNSALRIKQAGMGEASFDLSNSFAQTWQIPIKTSSSKEFFSKEQLASLSTDGTNSNGNEIENLYKSHLSSIEDSDFENDDEIDYPYVLTINRSVDGVFTQSIVDAAGNSFASWITHNDDVMITRNEYDKKTTQLSLSKIENQNGFESKYEYDDVGRLVASKTPDRGRTETKYDSKNRIRFTRDAKQISKGDGHFNIFTYDDEDRLVLTGEVRGNCNNCSFSNPNADLSAYTYPTVETIYGMPKVSDILKSDVPEVVKKNNPNVLNYDNKLKKLVKNIIDRIEGVLPHEAGAVISYNRKGLINTVKLSSYDNLGRVKINWTLNLFEDGAPIVETHYKYNTAGNIASCIVKKWNSSTENWEFVTGKSYTYEEFGRLESVSELLDEEGKSSKKLVEYTRNSVGTVEKVVYKDGGRVVVSKNSEHDIYGRTTKIEYTNESGKSVYSEDLKYKDPQINRVLETTHSWMLPGQNRKTFSNAFEYDDLGRLAKFTTNDAGVGNAEYDYDILGRLVSKFEKDTTLTYTYASGSYKPTAISANGNVIANALKYDVRGNVWLDGYNKSAYTLNSTGLPEHVALYRDVPSQLSLADVDEEIVYDEEFGHIKIAYDESGNRVWDRKYTRGGLIWDRVTIPGFGTYNKSRYTDFELERLELVGGGFRNGLGTEAVYPLMDAQGNVRAYAGLSGIKTAYDYRPFGRENALAEGMEGDVDNRRWQDKEYDGEHGKYFFGARYFDPFFGLWMSPDPAGQYANPYTYGGDPVNFIDPTGLWGLDAGFFTIGWDSNRGWNFGLSGGILSYTWYQNGSKTFEASVGGSYQWWILNFEGTFGYSYNTYSGHSISTHGHVCVGVKEDEAGVCAGLEAGGSMNWDAYGNFLGMTAYAGAFAELQASDNTSLVKVNGGYETGLFGMEGRGWYGGVSAMDGSLYASWAENGGWSYGFSKKFEAWNYSATENSAKLAILGLDVYSSNSMLLSVEGYWTTDKNVMEWAKYLLDDNENVFTFMAHGNEYIIGLEDPVYLPLPQSGKMDGIQFGERLNNGEFNYKGEGMIRLYSCSTGKKTFDGRNNFAQNVANTTGKIVIAPTEDVGVTVKEFFGVKWTSTRILNNGYWKVFRPQKR
ncbi:RHS repeat-associated core domain-containing protein [Fibrobacter sp. UWH4]|uniref:RHS repeat-associated core domain-containing protein n=1 Tax=Fibrobacter sp. UWH4 TaxID=1896210 RepID=UPI00091524E9|nr:RHS repeat-associated core domain-containing protein [Fibrobacter sp. UWH4]SHK88772.1 RHS repeat-associated core domain-containing protein [Fibrobacter sp. UWH4]